MPASATPFNTQDPVVVLVTGAARGIGRATATLFTERGATVVDADPRLGVDRG